MIVSKHLIDKSGSTADGMKNFLGNGFTFLGKLQSGKRSVKDSLKPFSKTSFFYLK